MEPFHHEVHVDGLVLMKVLQHVMGASRTVSGVLLGLETEHEVQVTYSFGLPEESSPSSSQDMQNTMVKLLKDLNYDNQVVGFYTSLSAYHPSVINGLFQHQQNCPNAVALVCEGNFPFKAFRLTDQFMEQHSQGYDGSTNEVLEEVEFHIRNAHVLNSIMFDMEEEDTVCAHHTSMKLDRGVESQKLMNDMSERLNFAMAKQSELVKSEREYQKSVQDHKANIEKRKAENVQRVKQGLVELPVDSELKSRPMPSRLDAILATQNAREAVEGIEMNSLANMMKMFGMNTVLEQ
eukprot:TRINITY_DN781827_c0_g1_i1.p1 TRINITY_DN781827_c0_g1~~TRINITY_DN781827_c0_g1_i1.p1  ORF type:complete len:308 (-),score=70.07 TRINITY_DN781827_c0_g1_i1:218-1096(-)